MSHWATNWSGYARILTISGDPLKLQVPGSCGFSEIGESRFIGLDVGLLSGKSFILR
jgi:hypothetical protein